MTRTLPPPALPVRSSMLLRVAQDGASGILQRDTGTIDVVDGRVVHAQSEAAPGLGDLLVGSCGLPPGIWQDALDRNEGHSRRAAEHLVKDGRLSEGALELCCRTAVFDAAYFALAPGGGPARFRHGAATDDGLALSLPADLILAESMRRYLLLDSLWPGPCADTPPIGRHHERPDRPVSTRRRALLDLADGSRTPAELARALGRPAFHVLLDLRRLAVDGLVAPPGPPAREPADRAPATHPPDARPRAPDGFATPDIALLQRVRDALEVCL
ncbi:DUF4388 domain-containing protein [Streptomyces sp. NPDC050418]|uniref:DUF4388 domain-containing protein n=1 Tax=Streptomyces sp. NPDC050418 TaxID=3365612 RepID=UPI0037BA3075